MKIHDVQQGSEAWAILRATIPTASEFDRIISPTWKIREGEGVQTYLCEKLAAAWMGGPLPGFSSWDTEQGNLLEQEAIPFSELEYGLKIERVGFITTDDGKCGCSPDGLIHIYDGHTSGIEIKCLQPTHHLKCLLDGELPKCFAAQVHGSMYVTDAPEWKILLYHRKFPPLFLTVERDEEIIDKIDEAVALFLLKFEEGMQKLVEANGGPPIRATRPEPAKERVKFSWETCPLEECDVIP